MAQPQTSNGNVTEWKIFAAQIIIGIVGVIALIKGGDGTVLTAVIVAEGTLGGVALAQAKTNQ
jgi:hypothetical protein